MSLLTLQYIFHSFFAMLLTNPCIFRLCSITLCHFSTNTLCFKKCCLQFSLSLTTSRSNIPTSMFPNLSRKLLPLTPRFMTSLVQIPPRRIRWLLSALILIISKSPRFRYVSSFLIFPSLTSHFRVSDLVSPKKSLMMILMATFPLYFWMCQLPWPSSCLPSGQPPLVLITRLLSTVAPIFIWMLTWVHFFLPPLPQTRIPDDLPVGVI